jgi:hypothetical protein
MTIALSCLHLCVPKESFNVMDVLWRKVRTYLSNALRY